MISPADLEECHTLIDLTELRSLEGNPHITPEGIHAASLDQWGQFESIVVYDGEIIIGNNRVRDALASGITQLAGYDLTPLDLDRPTVLGMALASNRIPQLGHEDPEQLAAAMARFEDSTEVLAAAGFNAEDLHLAEVLDEGGDLVETPAQRRSAYEDLPVRSIVLMYTQAQHQRVSMAFEDKRSEFGLNNNSAVLAHLLGLDPTDAEVTDA